jgi:glutathione S-transferase
MSNYELTYFPSRGRAEQIRLLLTLQGLSFDEKTPSNWMELKPETPFGLLPVFTDRSDGDELVIAESGAILRHLARKHDMYGNSLRHYAMCDALADWVAEARTAFVPIAYPAILKPSEAQVEQYWKQLPQTLGLLERALGRSTKPEAGWFVTDRPTFADVATFDLVDAISGLRPDCLADYPKLRTFMAQFRSQPTIASYLAARTMV